MRYGRPPTSAVPASARVQPEDHPHRGGLAGAVRADEAGDPPGRDGEGQPVDRDGRAVALAQRRGPRSWLPWPTGYGREPARPSSRCGSGLRRSLAARATAGRPARGERRPPAAAGAARMAADAGARSTPGGGRRREASRGHVAAARPAAGARRACGRASTAPLRRPAAATVAVPARWSPRRRCALAASVVSRRRADRWRAVAGPASRPRLVAVRPGPRCSRRCCGRCSAAVPACGARALGGVARWRLGRRVLLAGAPWPARARRRRAPATAGRAMADAAGARGPRRAGPIARELHDVVAHHISMIAVQAETARLTTPGMPAEGAERLRRDRRHRPGRAHRDAPAAGRAARGCRRRGRPRARSRVCDQLNELLDEAARRRGAGARLIVRGRVVPLDPGVELTAYRIVQEALTNARRHAPGAAVDVELGYARRTRCGCGSATTARARRRRGGAPGTV